MLKKTCYVKINIVDEWIPDRQGFSVYNNWLIPKQPTHKGS